MENKLVKGEAVTLVWYVDDLKVSHKEPFEVKKYQYFLKIYRNKLKVHIGYIHDYLGMDLDYSETGVVNVSMIKCLQKVLDEFQENLIGTPATPTADHLFQVRW